MPRHRPRYSDAVLREAVASGMTHREFEARFGLDNAIFYRLRRELTGAPSSRKPSPDDGELQRLVRAGCSPRQVADALGYTKRTIERRAAKLGLSWRHRPVRERAEWADWEDPQPGPQGVVPRDVFAAIYRERGAMGTAEYLGLHRNSVFERAARMRAAGALPEKTVTAPAPVEVR